MWMGGGGLSKVEVGYVRAAMFTGEKEKESGSFEIK